MTWKLINFLKLVQFLHLQQQQQAKFLACVVGAGRNHSEQFSFIQFLVACEREFVEAFVNSLIEEVP